MELGSGHLNPRTAQELVRLPQGNDHERVLGIIRRNHLNKDESAQLVSYWLHASEEEKKTLGKSGYTKRGPTVALCNTDKKWSGIVENHFSQCTQILTRVTDLAGQQTRISSWPMEAYRLLIRIEKDDVRNFYREECIRNQWSTRQLERQINSFYYERLL